MSLVKNAKFQFAKNENLCFRSIARLFLIPELWYSGGRREKQCVWELGRAQRLGENTLGKSLRGWPLVKCGFLAICPQISRPRMVPTAQSETCRIILAGEPG